MRKKGSRFFPGGIISGASGIIPLRFNQGNRNSTAVYPHYKLILWKSTILLMAEPRISLFQAPDNYRFNTGLGETFPLPYEMLATITASRSSKENFLDRLRHAEREIESLFIIVAH